MIVEQAQLTAADTAGGNALNPRLVSLQQRINDEAYLRAAIQRLALVLSKELMEITVQGRRYEQRKRR